MVATSGSYDFTLNCLQIINDAYSLLQLPGENQVLTSDNIALGQRFLNAIIKNFPTGKRVLDMSDFTIKLQHTFVLGSDSNIYLCIKRHTSNSSSEPIVGNIWNVFWEYLTYNDLGDYDSTRAMYSFADYVLASDGKQYICILGHEVDTTTTNPVTGTLKSQYWTLVSAWVTSTLYNPYNQVMLDVATYGEIADVVNVTKTDIDGNNIYCTQVNTIQQNDFIYKDNYSLSRRVIPELKILPFENKEINWTLSFSVYTVPEDFDASGNAIDFKNSWVRALKYKLAIDLAPCFGKHTGDTFSNLYRLSDEAYNYAFGSEGDKGDIQFYPGSKIKW